MKIIILYFFLLCPSLIFSQIDLTGTWLMQNNKSIAFDFKSTDSLDIINFNNNTTKSFGILVQDSSIFIHDNDIFFDTLNIIYHNKHILKTISNQGLGKLSFVSSEYQKKEKAIDNFLSTDNKLIELKIEDNKTGVENKFIYCYDSYLYVFSKEEKHIELLEWKFYYSEAVNELVLNFNIGGLTEIIKNSSIITRVDKNEIHGKSFDNSKTYIFSVCQQNKIDIENIKQKLKGTWIVMDSKEKVMEQEDSLHYKIYLGYNKWVINNDLNLIFIDPLDIEYKEDEYIIKPRKTGNNILLLIESNDYESYNNYILTIIEEIHESYMILKAFNPYMPPVTYYLKKNIY